MRKGEAACDKIYVKDVMTKDILIATPDDDINYAMAIMIERNIRHPPVVEYGKIISVLSIRDIVRSQVSTLEAEIHYLKDYISDKYPG
ncbi:MAG: CBS domain-containing protein [Nitrospirae bacterium]|nr:CBS domain-containing protein [Nitrospirota bacterium]